MSNVREDHNRAARFAVAAARIARQDPNVPPIEGRTFQTLQGPVTERQLAVAALRREEGLGPDPEDPNGEMAYGFLERAVR